MNKTDALDWGVGDTVYCPARGLGTVTERSTRSPLGVPREYLTIMIARKNMTIMVPIDEADGIGLRRPATRRAMRGVLDVLSQPPGDESEAWQARLKVNERKLGDGTMVETAEVVRDLSWRAADRRLGVRDKELLNRGRDQIEGQVAFAFDVDATSAHTMVSDPLPVPLGGVA
jgi:CarD family transcriptional regulator